MKKPTPGAGKSTADKPAAKRTAASPPTPTTDGLFDRVATILDAARSSVVRAVNHRMVLAYWLIGREIVQSVQEGQERAAYGKRVLDDLSHRLTARYGEGYSLPNLRLFRQFFQTYSDRVAPIRYTAGSESAPRSAGHPPEGTEHAPGILYAASSELHSTFHPSLSWSHYRALMRVEKPEARKFYEDECAAAGWNTRELERQVQSLYYERLLASPDRKGMLIDGRKAQAISDPAEILKSSTVLEFLGLPDTPRLHESALEQAIMDNLQVFLLEMGRGFSFVARQRLLRYEDDEFYVDLVFYNFLLKCFVLIDLKIGKLTHQDVGQMDSYVRLYEDLFKVEGDNPTIGLILCSQKNETIARYSVLKESKQLFASKYRLHLPSEAELAAELKREIQLIEQGRE